MWKSFLTGNLHHIRQKVKGENVFSFYFMRVRGRKPRISRRCPCVDRIVRIEGELFAGEFQPLPIVTGLRRTEQTKNWNQLIRT